MAILIVRSPQGDQTIQLSRGRLTIGRNPDNGVVLAAPSVSRSHAELDVRPDGVFITDVGSSGGTTVAGARLLPHQPRQLAPGEEVRIGPFALTYLADEPAASDPGEPGEPAPEVLEEPAALTTQTVETVSSAPEPAVPVAEMEATDGVGTTDGFDALDVAPHQIVFARRASDRYLITTHGTASRYLRYLPGIFQENDFLGRYLQIFETIWEPFEWRVDHLAMYFDPRTTPAGMLDWLASWLDLSLDAGWPEERRRRLLAEATDLYRWRGTRYGMTRMIEVCTGLTPDVSDDPATPFVFRVRLRIPPDSGVDAALVDDLVRLHKPAHAGYILELS